MTTTLERHPIPPRTIPPRRVDFKVTELALPRHYVDGDLVSSHIVSVLSALFPNGEDFFVNSVRNYRDVITDPEQKRQVAGFIGQEAIHGREHRELNDALSQLGFATRIVDRAVGLFFKRLAAAVLPKKTQLAVTAALEHYTATLGETLLEHPEPQELFPVAEVRSLFQWHALEESEHKAVAFDVYRAVGGGELHRRLVMNVTTVLFLAAIAAGTAISLLRDPAAYNPRRLTASLRHLRRSPFLSAHVRRRIRLYNRPSFHPDDIDSSTLVAKWRSELFGDGGALAGHVKIAGAAV